MRAILAAILLGCSCSVIALDDVVELLKREESFERNIYIDTEGFPTIGYGTRVTSPMMGDRILRADADMLLRLRIAEIHERLSSNPTYLSLPQHKRDILISMVYQMGHYGVSQFRDMWAALEQGDYESAGDAMKDSLWYTQTTNRAERHIETIKGY